MRHDLVGRYLAVCFEDRAGLRVLDETTVALGVEVDNSYVKKDNRQISDDCRHTVVRAANHLPAIAGH
ncbi:hypothetical protein KCU83_g404, partial [Aureobasidium melanogenum]